MRLPLLCKNSIFITSFPGALSLSSASPVGWEGGLVTWSTRKWVVKNICWAEGVAECLIVTVTNFVHGFLKIEQLLITTRFIGVNWKSNFGDGESYNILRSSKYSGLSFTKKFGSQMERKLTFRRLAHAICHSPSRIETTEALSLESLNSEVICFLLCVVLLMLKSISVTRPISSVSWFAFDLRQCKMIHSFVHKPALIFRLHHGLCKFIFRQMFKHDSLKYSRITFFTVVNKSPLYCPRRVFGPRGPKTRGGTLGLPA